MSQSFKSVADVMNAFGLAVFPVKNNPGRITVSFINSAGKRQFLDRKQILKEDGTQTWVWTVGKELEAKTPAAQATQAQIQVA